MPNDFKHKEPSKTEKMLYEIVMNMNSMEKGLWSTSAHVVSLGLVLGVAPEKIAEMMVNGDEKMKEYSKKVNDEIHKLEEKKHPHKHDAAAEPAVEAKQEMPEIEASAEEKVQE